MHCDVRQEHSYLVSIALLWSLQNAEYRVDRLLKRADHLGKKRALCFP